MSYTINITPIAKNDIKYAAHWYNKKQKGLGNQFLKQVRLITTSIEKNPFNYAVRFDEVHTAVLKRFPYMIHYLVDKTEFKITIIGVFHTSLNPEKWKNITL